MTESRRYESNSTGNADEFVYVDKQPKDRIPAFIALGLVILVGFVLFSIGAASGGLILLVLRLAFPVLTIYCIYRALKALWYKDWSQAVAFAITTAVLAVVSVIVFALLSGL